MALQVRFRPKFPASVLGGTGITVSKSGGIYTFRFSMAGLSVLPSIPIADEDNLYSIVYNSDTGVNSRLTIATLRASIGLADVIVAGGPTGSSTVVPVITYNAKGQLTAVSTANITAAVLGAVPTSRLINTTAPLAGGGDLSADRTLSITGSALTKTDDTNVTLTLGGSPSSALLAAVSLTLGWTGTLAAGRLNSNVVQGITNDTNITGSIAAQVLTLGWTGTLAAARLNSNVVQGVTNDTNVTGSIAGQVLTIGWAGTLAAARLNANVVQSVINDTNITGSIAAQALTLGWTGTLAAARLNANVVQSVVNDTNVTGSISAQVLTIGWAGTLAVARQAGRPTSTADNTLPRFDGTGGNFQTSGVVVDDSNNVSALGALDGASNLPLNATSTGVVQVGTSTGDAYPTTWAVAQVGRNFAFANDTRSASTVAAGFLTQNAYFNVSSQWIYISSSSASSYFQNVGTHVFRTAASGTAGNVIAWINSFDINTSGPRILGGTAIPAGGTAGSGLRFSSTSNFGVFFGSGAPTLAAAKGSLYLRSDGSGTGDRMYVNTNGSTTWTAVTTAA